MEIEIENNSQIITIVKKFFFEINLEKNIYHLFSDNKLFGKISFESFFCKIAIFIIKNLNISLYFFLLMKKNLNKKYALFNNLRILNILSNKKFKHMKKIIDSTRDFYKKKNEIEYSIFKNFINYTKIDLKYFFDTNNLYLKNKDNENDYMSIYNILYDFENFKNHFENLSFKLPKKFIGYAKG